MPEVLHIFNTLSRAKEVFKSLRPGQVRMYVCGMTVYDFCHLGHARVMVVFDIIKRWLEFMGYEVIYVRNITDIDDKIIRRALERDESIRTLTDRFILAMHEDADALGVARPNHEPRATEFVPQMLGMITRLVEKGLAYQSEEGDVNFAVRRFPGYGRLSGKTLDELRAGERVSVAESKHDPLDFVLWKSAKPNEPEEAVWPSSFGAGRPGWHIECSAMSCGLLGEHFDIHGGGADLQFPHHENEIAQSVGATGRPFANFWMHNGFVRVDTEGVSEKMSKSLGNFFTIRDILQLYDAEIVRFFILRAHYRSPLTYSAAHIEDAKAALTRLYIALNAVCSESLPTFDVSGQGVAAFTAAMNDDFNTPEAVAVLFELAGELNRTQSLQLAAQLKGLGASLGILQRDPAAFLQGRLLATQQKGQENAQVFQDQIEQAIAERAQAKRDKNFALADQIRQNLLDQGVVLEDKAGGLTQWRRQ
jgi:cysteinyl-tRNA synthetase